MKTKNKLELKWIGKDEKKKIEPRILVEDIEKSYGDVNSGNLLIHGDNLLALKSLEQDYFGKIKCIYIDPPFNTGAAFELYNDNIEHSIWINLMYYRIKILHNLLSNDGVLLIELDDNEAPYLRIVLDEIFGRNKFVANICVKSNNISGAKTANKEKTILRNKDNIIVYKKSDTLTVNPQYVERTKWDTHYNTYINFEGDKVKESLKLKDVLINKGIIKSDQTIKEDIINDKNFYKFIIENQGNICRLVNSIPAEMKEESLKYPDEIITYIDNNNKKHYAYNGNRISFLKSSITKIDGEEKFSQLLGDLWIDIDFQNTQNEGGVSFPASKKPEYLIRRILNLFTNRGDYVLDSFLGSGTTCAVAQKMGRKWIGIEMGNHIYSHCIPRLNSIIDGKDNSGISKYVDFKKGGGYKFYELAPSLLNKDKYGNWIISTEYDADMLAEAMCIHNGFKYIKDQDTFYKQGFSTERDYIFTTTNYVTVHYLDMINECMNSKESLLICCKSFDEECLTRYKNISIQKIPQSILKKYEFGDVDYTLNINDLEEEVDDDEQSFY
ncbi:MAG: site-specific DNA-methyltransferase [Ignavibacteriales bacterium]